jgi:hypothetical protein
MAESSDDFRSRVQEYKQGLEDLLVDAQVAIDRQAPDLLDKVAATARNVAQHMDELASEARRRAEQREATPDAATPGPASEAESEGGGAPPEDAATAGGEPSPDAPDEPPRSAGESGTAA